MSGKNGLWKAMGLILVVAAMAMVGCEQEGGGEQPQQDQQGIINKPGASTSPGGFLWKPVSHSNNKAVMLFPVAMTGKIISGEVHSSMPPTLSSLVEAGWFGGVHNGGREHFRLQKTGSAYGDDIYAIAVLTDGSFVAWHVPKGANRTEY